MRAQTYGMFVENFYDSGGRLDHMTMVMGMHARYLRLFLDTTSVLFQANGALTSDCRYYIAIMVGSFFALCAKLC